MAQIFWFLHSEGKSTYNSAFYLDSYGMTNVQFVRSVGALCFFIFFVIARKDEGTTWQSHLNVYFSTDYFDIPLDESVKGESAEFNINSRE